ncbi:MAG: homocysteine S-methyltransferase family protein [Pikeienuella sp.]
MAEVILIDGSMGQEIVNRSGQEPTGLWSTKVMREQPEIVEAVHADYIDAGAKVIGTNTYGLLRDRLVAAGIEPEFEALHKLGCEIAAKARGEHDAAIAGCMGPMGWSYRPDMAPKAELAAPYYSEIAELQKPYVDLFMIETMCSVDQSRGALMGACGHDVPVWLCLSVDENDGTLLRSGEPLEDIAPLLEEFDVEAALLNCSPPEAIDAGLPVLEEMGLTCGAYANGFTKITPEFAQAGANVGALSARTDLGPEAYADFGLGWVDMGARIVGGCCEVGPEHIKVLRSRLIAAGHTVRGI